jgi:serine O-acetyltransferase
MADELLDRSLALLFPHFAGARGCARGDIEAELGELESLLTRVGEVLREARLPAPDARAFAGQLGSIREALVEDAEAFVQRDPAASGLDEVVLAYPGFRAIASHRVAHALHRLGVPLVPRLLSERAHHQTGVDIHPGARIGRRFVIDHGTGVVIGETCVIGNGVTLYQGVTLGAIAVEKELAQKKRHPTLEDHVVVYANATILGGETVIGHDSVIGGNAWLTQSVPPYSQVTQSEVRRRIDRRSDAPEFHI